MLFRALALFLVAAAAQAQPFVFEQSEEALALRRDGALWLSTQIAPYDPETAEETYKVFTHIYDFAGEAPITKGAGGQFTHHRGMFIGWNKTELDGTSYDTWHMTNCTQQFVDAESLDEEAGRQTLRIDWRNDDGEAFIRETRTIAASADGAMRVFDFQSELVSAGEAIALRGDPQHAGMQLRLANEVSEHPETTEYVLPEGAERLDNDVVEGGWWAMCSTEVGGQRYWILHMTHPSLLTGTPTYSIRAYARFGSFFEPDIPAAGRIESKFRIVVSETPLDQEACAALYADYSAE